MFVPPMSGQLLLQRIAPRGPFRAVLYNSVRQTADPLATLDIRRMIPDQWRPIDEYGSCDYSLPLDGWLSLAGWAARHGLLHEPVFAAFTDATKTALLNLARTGKQDVVLDAAYCRTLRIVTERGMENISEVPVCFGLGESGMPLDTARALYSLTREVAAGSTPLTRLHTALARRCWPDISVRSFATVSEALEWLRGEARRNSLPSTQVEEAIPLVAVSLKSALLRLLLQ